MLEAVIEAVGAEEAGRIVGFKKGDMADAAERLLEDRGWLPPVLRTIEAVPNEPSSVEAVTGVDDACSLAAE